MKTICGKIFTVKISVDREKEDGLVKKTREEYSLKAISFTDCEAKITKEVGSADNIKASFEVLSEAVAPYKEIYVFDQGETWYKVKIKENWLDDFGNDKSTPYTYLLNAESFEQARKNIVEALGNTMKDYTIAAVVETKTLDVFE